MLKLIDGTELTEEVKEAFKKSITSAYIKMNDGTILSSANYLKTIKLEDFRYNEETGNIIGEAISKRVTLGLFNQENALNIENKEFELIIGTQLSLNEENNFYDIDDVLLMSKDMTINDDDTVTATFDNTNGTEAQYLNLFTNVSGFLGTSEKYFAVLEIIDVSGTGGIILTESGTELEKFSDLQNGQLLKYKIKTLDNFLKSNTVLKSYVKFNPGESGSITFRISIFQNDVNMHNFEYKKFNSNNKYISFGNFIVQKPENNDTKESTDFEAFDYMCKTNKKYVPGVEFPCTYAQLAEDVCNQCGLELGNNAFRNADKLVSENFFIDSEQCRVVLKEIAKIAFSWVRVATDNKVYFDFHKRDIQDADEIFTLDDYIELEPNDETIPINTIVLRNSAIESENITIKDDDLIAEYGKQKELVVKEDYFAYSQEKRQELIEASRELMGLVYYPVNLKSIGTIYLENNDIIGVQNKKGDILNTYCFNHTIDFNGVLFDRIESPAMTEVETELQHESAEDLSKRRTEILVNKAMQQIEATVRKDDVIARINMALEKDYGEDIPEGVEKSIIQFFANNLEWQADHSEMTKDGILKLKNTSNEPYAFTEADVINLMNYVEENATLTDEQKELYDLTGDGKLNVLDAVKMLNVIKGTATVDKYTSSEIIFDPSKPNEFIKMLLAGVVKFQVGLNEVYSQSFRGLNVFLGTFAGIQEIYGIFLDGEKGKIKITNDEATTETVIDAGKIDAYYVLSGSRNKKGRCLHGVDESHDYLCHWNGAKLQFFVDDTNVGELSDKNVKEDIIEINDKLISLVDELGFKQFKLANRNGKISVGVIAQDLLELFKKYELNPNDFDFTYDAQFKLTDETLYHFVNYEQLLILQNASMRKKIIKQQKAIEFLAEKLGYTEEIDRLLT